MKYEYPPSSSDLRGRADNMDADGVMVSVITSRELRALADEKEQMQDGFCKAWRFRGRTDALPWFLVCVLLILVGALGARQSCAQTWVLDVHGASWHSDRSAGYCERNPGLGVTREDDRARAVKVGAYRNSECNWTAYVAARWTPLEPLQGVRLGLAAGAFTGYERAPVVAAGAFVAVVDLTERIGLEVMGGYIPRHGAIPEATVATVSLRWRL